MALTGNRALAGLYFVVDLTMETGRLLPVVEGALRGGADLIQIWSGSRGSGDCAAVVKAIRQLTSRYNVPLIINNDIAMAQKVKAEGVHMDGYELSPSSIRGRLGEGSLVGYTIGNDLERVEWAEQGGADYISFCSVFPSTSVMGCDIVPLETVRRARTITDLPIFASGGITLANARSVLDSGADGIAVISAIQNSDDPETTTRKFKAEVDSAAAHGGSSRERLKNRTTKERTRRG